jgi:hypothetical protein
MFSMPAQSMAAIQSGTRDALLSMEKDFREEEGSEYRAGINRSVLLVFGFWFLASGFFIRFEFDS